MTTVHQILAPLGGEPRIPGLDQYGELEVDRFTWCTSGEGTLHTQIAGSNIMLLAEFMVGGRRLGLLAERATAGKAAPCGSSLLDSLKLALLGEGKQPSVVEAQEEAV